MGFINWVSPFNSRGLRVRPDILRGARESYNSAQHEPDHRENDETDVVAAEVLVVFSEASATTEPAVGPLNDPALGQKLQALGRVRTLDDLERDAGLILHVIGRRFALIAAVGDGLCERWKAHACAQPPEAVQSYCDLARCRV